MNFIEVSILILLLAVLSVPLATRFRIPFEIFLLIGSGVVSLIPGLAIMRISPIVIFELFLPPILFFAAYFTSWREFKANWQPISLLAIGLVIFTTVAVAIITKWIFPNFTWAQGFLLGAIVSPTDTTSATALIRKLGAPRQLITIIEGESLINDATALILFRFSLIAIISGTFSLPDFAAHFFIVTIGGAFVGILITFLGIYILRILKDTQAEITFTFLLAFISFIAAEHLGFSGVISTVVSGLAAGRFIPVYAPSQTRVNARASWLTFLFIMNFTIIAHFNQRKAFAFKRGQR